MIDVEIEDITEHLDVNSNVIMHKIKQLIDLLDLNDEYDINVNINNPSLLHLHQQQQQQQHHRIMQVTEAQSINIGIYIYTINEFDMKIISKYMESDDFKQQLKGSVYNCTLHITRNDNKNKRIHIQIY